MAERSTGPVQPPVIDLTARNTNARPEDRPPPSDSASERRPPRRRISFDTTDANWPLLGAVSLSGALLGTALTYLLATVVPLPSRPPEIPVQPEIAAHGERLAGLEGTVAELGEAVARTETGLAETGTRLDQGLARLEQSIADAVAPISELPEPVDLGPLEEQLRTLRAQVDAIAAGASGTDASAIAQSLAAVDTAIAGVNNRLAAIDGTVTALRTDLDAARTALDDHLAAPAVDEAGPPVQLPLILSGFETALANGRPFATELNALRSAMPDLQVPPGLAEAAATGLPRPDLLLQRFEATVPAILAAREVAVTDWTQGAVDWAKTLLALRPAEEIEGDSPEAVVSRLEAAMHRRDYRAAIAALDALPEAMRSAAAPVAADIRTHAEADALVATLRERALAETATP